MFVADHEDSLRTLDLVAFIVFPWGHFPCRTASCGGGQRRVASLKMLPFYLTHNVEQIASMLTI
jgi:hypothetical protein